MVDTSFAGDAAKAVFGDLPMNSARSVARGIAQASADPKMNGIPIFPPPLVAFWVG
jgi:hypothetical protein